MNKTGLIGSIIVWGLALVSVVLWFTAPVAVPRWTSGTQILASLGQIAGLLGASLFAINLILSARLRFVEKLFAGLNRVYARHAQYGKYATILLLIHPSLLIAKYAGGSWSGALTFLLPNQNWPVNWGKLALLIMITLVILTLYLRPKYHIWKWTHKFFGLAFFLASLHMWLIPSDIASYQPLRYYVLGLAALGLTAYVYHSLLGHFLVRRSTYTVTNVTVLKNFVTQVTMRPTKQPLQFTPGQFIFVSFADPTVGAESHPFSLTSGPAENTISISAKKLGDYTEKLPQLKVDTIVRIEGPFGMFSYKHADYKKQIWIAGGIGITPFVSMAKDLAATPNGYAVKLYYSVKNENEAVYIELLQQLAAQSQGTLRVELFCSETQGRISAEYISKQTADLKDCDIFLCAPPPMIQALKKQFRAKDVPATQLHSEEFSL